MAIEIINVGTSPNDGNGDALRNAFIKCNDNFDELDTTKIGGSGTDNYVPKFNGTDAVENSQIFDDGTNVIVGATSGPHKFSVNGKIGGNIYGDSFLEFTSGGNTLLKANDDVIIGYSQNTIVKQNGNVGIGTTSPEVKLDIYGTGTIQHRLQSSSGGDIRFSVDSVGRLGTYSASDLLLLSSGAERMRITSSGRVGIGLTNPSSSAILHLKSNSKGFLPPTMSTSERNSIGGPENGLVIYNTDSETIDVFTTGGGWKSLSY